MLGRSARLACELCTAALLDLSICWVCGEVVFRGDECVSFGWCFWHRACYGCLLCGSRRICSGVPPRALFRDDADGPEDAGDRRTRGREVREPPLCAVCMVDVEMDGLSDEAVVRKGLWRVDAADGDVTNKRWAMKEGSQTRHARADEVSLARTRRGTRAHAAQGRRHDPLAAPTGGDGTGRDAASDDGASIIWVDMHDLVNRLSFKPRPLKPVPRFMRPRAAAAPWHHETEVIFSSARHRSPGQHVVRDAARPRKHRSAIVREEPLKRPSRPSAPNRHSEPHAAMARDAAGRDPRVSSEFLDRYKES